MFEVVLCYIDTLEPMKTLFKGSYDQCVAHVEHEVHYGEYDFDELSIINQESGRHVSYIINVNG